MASADNRRAQRRSSLIVGLIAALLAVAALPFGLAAYQIHLARESLVDQSQRTHLIAARASADRVTALLSALQSAADSAAQNPQLYSEPASDAAREVLAGILLGQANVLAAATFYRDGEQDVLVQLARRPDADVIEADDLQTLQHAVLLRNAGEQRQWGLSRETGRSGLRIAVLADATALEATLSPQELGDSAHLLLLQGATAHPAFTDPTPLSATLLKGIAQPQLLALATRADAEAGVEVSAFARVAGTDWSVVSLQLAAEAESAAASMRRGAFAAMAAVLLLVAALSVFAWRSVVQPVRALLDWQRGMLAGGANSGGDLASLKAAFTQIKRHQRNREAMSEVFLGRYKLLSTLGQGAMGSVFLAWDPRLKRHVAIKTIHIEALDPQMQKALAQTLENEAVAVANLRHPNIVGVFDLVAAGEFAFVVMEYVDGGNLRTVVSRNGALSAGEVVLIARSMLKALSAAHAAGLLHLDIKPANVLVPPTGELKLTDFGVSTWRFEIPALVARGGLAGTPGFIAPEYVNGSPPSERSDLYSLGRLLVECMTGAQQNIGGAKTNGLRRAAMRPLELPERLRRAEPELCAALMALCELDPSKRVQTAELALTLFGSMSEGDAAERLAQRAQELGGETRLHAVDSPSATAARFSADITVPLPAVGDATRPAPLRVETEADSNPRRTGDADGGESPANATRPPPLRVALDATLPSPWVSENFEDRAQPTSGVTRRSIAHDASKPAGSVDPRRVGQQTLTSPKQPP